MNTSRHTQAGEAGTGVHVIGFCAYVTSCEDCLSLRYTPLVPTVFGIGVKLLPALMAPSRVSFRVMEASGPDVILAKASFLFFPAWLWVPR